MWTSTILSPTGQQMRNYCSEVHVNVAPPSAWLMCSCLPSTCHRITTTSLKRASHYFWSTVSPPARAPAQRHQSGDVQGFWAEEGGMMRLSDQKEYKFYCSRPSEWMYLKWRIYMGKSWDQQCFNIRMRALWFILQGKRTSGLNGRIRQITGVNSAKRTKGNRFLWAWYTQGTSFGFSPQWY